MKALIKKLNKTNPQPIHLPEAMITCFPENHLGQEVTPYASKKRIALFMALWIGAVGVGCVSHGGRSSMGNAGNIQGLQKFLIQNNKNDVKCSAYAAIFRSIEQIGTDIACTDNISGEHFGVRCHEKTDNEKKGCEFIPLPKSVSPP